jgi:hypothetical protein
MLKAHLPQLVISQIGDTTLCAPHFKNETPDFNIETRATTAEPTQPEKSRR